MMRNNQVNNNNKYNFVFILVKYQHQISKEDNGRKFQESNAMVAHDIINVTESNFEYEVINYSHNIPVVVDFWAEWCVPCKMLDPILRKLTLERSGEFRLAKVGYALQHP